MTTITPYRSDLRAGRDGFAQLLRAEWTKFRTVRGWMIGMTAAALVTILLGVLFAAGSHSSCSKGPIEVACPVTPVGPGGEAVDDRFYFVHKSLTGDGSITARVNTMTGQIRKPDVTPGVRNVISGVVPWAKAGVLIKESTKQGSAYAALMVTGSHGVRMQHNFTEDVAGRPGGVSKESPRWLRLTRSGDTLTGYESADGTNWTKVGTARLAGLPSTVRVGLFATSPGDLTVGQAAIGGVTAAARFTEVTAVMDQVDLQGAVSGGPWSHDDVGVVSDVDGTPHHPGGVVESGGTFTVTGVGDMAPGTEGMAIERTLTGALSGLIVVIVMAVMFITAEYRRGLIRTTLIAAPGRGRMLAAKATVIAMVTFVTGLIAAAVTVEVGTRMLRANGNPLLPVSPLTELRVVVGTAAFLAVAAVFALALGVVFRRSVAAVVTAIVLIVLPYVLATTSVLPLSGAQWLLRLTPAAGFAIQQSVPEYAHVLGYYAPQMGYYPLAPWAGLAVTCGYAALALGLAAFLLSRRDA
ncbi:ABC transporter permease subunit [Sphaerisporangium perillae]|uniref:ABC transporter permease subunit n=1 Tax=Sphaerisporangium perillae TaxID=2935860 RepID=UPI00200F7A32|nr:ABC transporter permease subunit [Sphaerisporangium perillae]